jgi:hypothetical protein
MSSSPYAVDWYDGTAWYTEVYCPTLDDALIVAMTELRQAMTRDPEGRYTLRILGLNTYVTLDSDPERS